MEIPANDQGILVTPIVSLASLAQMPRCVYQEYAGSLEEAFKYHLAKFHSLPPVVYQYQYRYFFPLTEKADGGIL